MLRQLGPARLLTMGLVVVGLIAFFMFVTSRLATPELSLLYGDLPIEDAGEIAGRLDAMNVPYELRGEGRQIYVPADDVSRLRLLMAADGLPNGGSVGYELFDKSDSIGTTSFVQRLNHLRALEGELARTIAAIGQVQTARVHLVLPRRELFSRTRQEPSASIVLKLRGGALQSGQVLAIQHLVATAVPDLRPERISIVDSQGRLLARGGGNGEGDQPLSAVNADEARQRYETRLAHAIEELLERSVGIGRVRAEVTANLNFDRLTESNEVYDPDGQVVRSTQTIEQADASADSDTADTVSIANNLPNADATQGGESQRTSNSDRTEETVNFEISRKVTTLVRESGEVRKLSVAVIVDGIYGESGEYQPRSDEQMAQLAALVRSAIGYDEARGDQVEVVNLPFTRPEVDDSPAEAGGFMGLGKSDLFQIAEMLVFGVVSVLVVLLVVRPLVTRMFETLPAGGGGVAAGGATALSGGARAQLAAPGGDGVAAIGMDGEEDDEPSVRRKQSRQLDLTGIEGSSANLARISEIVEKHPDETIAIMRSWLYQET
jgi:flagellar M-ring protein FliF